MTGTDIRETLHEISHSLVAPMPDRLAFQAEVRRERRRRTAGRVLVAGAAAACVGGIAALSAGVLPEPALRPAPPVAGSAATGDVGGVVYAVVDGRLTAWDGISATPLRRVEGLLGSTQERVWAVDQESRIVVSAVVNDPEGPLPAGFTDEDAPYDGPVQSAALSDDGRFLAWVGLDQAITVYDLKAEDVAWEVDGGGGDSRYLLDVSAEGVLVADWNELELFRPGGGGIDVQPTGGTSGLDSQLAPGRLLVSGTGGDATLMAVGDGGARELRSFEGLAAISPEGGRVVSWTEEGRSPRLWTEGAGEESFADLDGVSVSVARWVDDGSEAGLVLMTGYRDGASRLFACDPVSLGCGMLPLGEGEVRITR